MSDSKKLPRLKNEDLDFTYIRWEREETIVDLRKQKREEQIAKRRNVFFEAESDAELATSSSAQISEQPNTVAQGNTVSKDIIKVEVKNMLNSEDYKCQFEAAQKIRIAVSSDQDPPIKEVMEFVPQLATLLQSNDKPSLQFEAAWIFTNILAGTSEQIQTVLEAGVVPIFIELLSSPHNFLRKQAVWALGNIAADSIKFRDHLLSSGILPPLLRIISTSERVTLLSNALRTFASLCRGKDPPIDFSKFKHSLPILAQLLHNTDMTVLSYTCWAISHLSDGPTNQIQAIIDAGACRRLVQLLLHPQHNVCTAALRAVGNLLTGTDLQAQVVLNCKILPNITFLLGSSTATCKKECCWIVSNIAAGGSEHIQALIDAKIFPVVFKAMQKADFRTQKEAAWAISNATTHGTTEQIDYLVQAGCVPPLCELLTVADSDIVLVALRALANISKTGQKLSPFLKNLEECGGLEKLENLQTHENREIYHKSFEFIDQHFGDEKDETTLEPIQAIAEYEEYEINLQLGETASERGFDS